MNSEEYLSDFTGVRHALGRRLYSPGLKSGDRGRVVIADFGPGIRNKIFSSGNLPNVSFANPMRLPDVGRWFTCCYFSFPPSFAGSLNARLRKPHALADDVSLGHIKYYKFQFLQNLDK